MGYGAVATATRVTQSIALLAKSAAAEEGFVDRSAKTQTSALAVPWDYNEPKRELVAQPDAKAPTTAEQSASVDKTKAIQSQSAKREQQLRWLWTAAVISVISVLSAAIWVALKL